MQVHGNEIGTEICIVVYCKQVLSKFVSRPSHFIVLFELKRTTTVCRWPETRVFLIVGELSCLWFTPLWKQSVLGRIHGATGLWNLDAYVNCIAVLLLNSRLRKHYNMTVSWWFTRQSPTFSLRMYNVLPLAVIFVVRSRNIWGDLEQRYKELRGQVFCHVQNYVWIRLISVGSLL